jgi:hypothetical protein
MLEHIVLIAKTAADTASLCGGGVLCELHEVPTNKHNSFDKISRTPPSLALIYIRHLQHMLVTCHLRYRFVDTEHFAAPFGAIP